MINELHEQISERKKEREKMDRKYKNSLLNRLIMEKSGSEYFQRFSLKMKLLSNLVSGAEFLRFRRFYRHPY